MGDCLEPLLKGDTRNLDYGSYYYIQGKLWRPHPTLPQVMVHMPVSKAMVLGI